MKRRRFLQTIGGSASITGMAISSRQSVSAKDPPSELIDCNVTIGPWPFRKLLGEDPKAFARMLRAKGVTEAWTGSFEGLLHQDIEGVNRRLVETCQSISDLNMQPVGTIHLGLDRWDRDLERCRKDHRMRIFRLYPNYHGYELNDSRFREFLSACNPDPTVLQICAQLEDERTQHPRLRAKPVDLSPLISLCDEFPGIGWIVLNANQSHWTRLRVQERIHFDLAMLEGAAGLEAQLKVVSHERILFGSHSPFFYWESAKLKLQEASPLDRHLRSVLSLNARRIFG